MADQNKKLKPVKQEWSSCQLDFVKEFILNHESDIEKLPACCVGSKATVTETNNRYVCCKDGTWKLESTDMEEGPGEGGGSGGGVKTAIIKASNYDGVLDFLNGKTSELPDIENVTFSCTNMTFQDVYSAILAGEQVNIVCMFAPEGPVIQDVSFMALEEEIAMDVLFSFMGTTRHYKTLFWGESGISVDE